jgi:hypothetical protein
MTTRINSLAEGSRDPNPNCFQHMFQPQHTTESRTLAKQGKLPVGVGVEVEVGRVEVGVGVREIGIGVGVGVGGVVVVATGMVVAVVVVRVMMAMVGPKFTPRRRRLIAQMQRPIKEPADCATQLYPA